MNKIKVNPNEEVVKAVREALAKNDWYCPCSLEKNKDTKCLCKAFRDLYNSGKVGTCNCGLYISYIDQPTVCLCGSTKFKDKFFEVARWLTLEGKIVLMPFVFGHSGDSISEKEKENLDQLHFNKIDKADSIFVINVGRYIGESTRKEIEYARITGKKIEYLEEVNE